MASEKEYLSGDEEYEVIPETVAKQESIAHPITPLESTRTQYTSQSNLNERKKSKLSFFRNFF